MSIFGRLQKKSKEGETHNQTIRALGQHLCRIINDILMNYVGYVAWNDPKSNIVSDVWLPLNFDEERYIKSNSDLVGIRAHVKFKLVRSVYRKKHPIHISGFQSEVDEILYFPGLTTHGFSLGEILSEWENLGDVDIKPEMEKSFIGISLNVTGRFSEKQICEILPNKCLCTPASQYCQTPMTSS